MHTLIHPYGLGYYTVWFADVVGNDISSPIFTNFEFPVRVNYKTQTGAKNAIPNYLRVPKTV